MKFFHRGFYSIIIPQGILFYSFFAQGLHSQKIYKKQDFVLMLEP